MTIAVKHIIYFVLGSYSMVELLLIVVRYVSLALVCELCTVSRLGSKCAVRLRGVEPREMAAVSGRPWQWAAWIRVKICKSVIIHGY